MSQLGQPPEEEIPQKEAGPEVLARSALLVSWADWTRAYGGFCRPIQELIFEIAPLSTPCSASAATIRNSTTPRIKSTYSTVPWPRSSRNHLSMIHVRTKENNSMLLTSFRHVAAGPISWDGVLERHEHSAYRVRGNERPPVNTLVIARPRQTPGRPHGLP